MQSSKKQDVLLATGCRYVRTTSMFLYFYGETLYREPRTSSLLKQTPNEDGNGPKDVENVQIFPLAVFVWLFCQYLSSRGIYFFSFIFIFFASCLSSSWLSYIGSLFINEEQEKVGLWRNVHFCHIIMPPALFMTSQTQTTRHKISVLTAVLSRL